MIPYLLRNRFLLLLTYVLLLLLLSSNLLDCVKVQKKVLRPDNVNDVVRVKEKVKEEMAKMWIISDLVYAQHENTTPAIMANYWSQLLPAFYQIDEMMRYYDRKVHKAQPSTLMNVIFNTQDMETLTEMAKTPTENSSIYWHVRFLEISSLSTQANWFFDKRVYDILHANKYLQSVANSISTLYGYPWIAPISVKKEEINSRLEMREFWLLVKKLIVRESHGQIFAGIRKLIDESKEALSSSTIDSDSCTDQDFGKILPIRLDGPMYVYGLTFPNIPQLLIDRVDEDVSATLKLYNESFWDYQSVFGHKLIPVMAGYFKCDPAELNSTNHIEIVNYQNYFIVPQSYVDPTGECEEGCPNVGKTPSPINCTRPKDAKEKDFCDKLPCPLDKIQCSNHANPRGAGCRSKNPNQLYDWFEMGYRRQGANNSVLCPVPLVTFSGRDVTVSNVTEDKVVTKDTLEVGSRARKNINDEDKATAERDECEVCMCQCYDPIDFGQGKGRHTVRTFSTREVLANLAENRVIVGAKFEKVGDQIHLAVADAVMLPGYYVDMETIVWRKPSGPAPPEATVALDKNIRSFLLQSWRAEPDTVITGLRFVASSVKGLTTIAQYIGFEVMETKIDAVGGKLKANASEWIEKKKGGKETTGDNIFNGYIDPDHPTRLDGISLPNSAAEQLIRFRTTSLKKQGGQAVIPFFDAQEVVFPDKPFALKGVGVYHRHKVGFGGFLGFKLLPYEEKHLRR